MSRPEERIDRILYKVREYWKQYPDLRLTQLVNNMAHEGGWTQHADTYHCDDWVVERGLDKALTDEAGDE